MIVALKLVAEVLRSLLVLVYNTRCYIRSSAAATTLHASKAEGRVASAAAEEKAFKIFIAVPSSLLAGATHRRRRRSL